MRGATAGAVSGDGLTLTNVPKPSQASGLHSRMHLFAFDSSVVAKNNQSCALEQDRT